MAKEISKLKEIEKVEKTSRIFTSIYIILSLITFLMTLYDETFIVLFVASIGIAILFNIDLRYWNTKHYTLKMFNKLKN